MTRKEVYAEIKRMNLQKKIKDIFGMNFTNVSTVNLEYIVRKNINATQNSSTSTEVPSRLNKLIEVLEKKRILLKSEVDYINK